MQVNRNKSAQQPAAHIALWIDIKGALYYSTFPYNKETLD